MQTAANGVLWIGGDDSVSLAEHLEFTRKKATEIHGNVEYERIPFGQKNPPLPPADADAKQQKPLKMVMISAAPPNPNGPNICAGVEVPEHVAAVHKWMYPADVEKLKANGWVLPKPENK